MRVSTLRQAACAAGIGLALAATGGVQPALPLTGFAAFAAGAATAPPHPVARAQAAPASNPAPAAALDRTLLDRYCVTCHNERMQTAGLLLDQVDLDDLRASAPVLEKVVRKLRSGQMPPASARQPDQPAVDAFTAALVTALDDFAAEHPNPGRVSVRRLNRTEYANAIRDLLALEIDGASLLPADTSAFGFDNIADALSVTPVLMNRYMSAAVKISRLAIGDPATRPVIQVHRAPQFGRQSGRMGEDFPFGTRGGLAVRHAFPLDGEYTFRIRLQREQQGYAIRGLDHEHEIEVRVDGARVQGFTAGGRYPGNDPGILLAIPEDDVEAQRRHAYNMTADAGFNFRLAVKAGVRLVTVAFVDAAPAQAESLPLLPRSIKFETIFSEAGDPGIDTVEIAGPYGATRPADTPARRRIFVCRPAAPADEEPCAEQILGTLARRAYRRPVSGADLEQLIGLYRLGRAGRDFEGGIQRALEGMLSFPAFLFRIEQDPAGVRPGDAYRISDLELASRLSFFLWRSIPDDELLGVAERGRLQEAAVLEQQVRRMLADPRARRWMTDFMGQWLLLRNLRVLEPDPAIFPEFDHTLRANMATETELFFESQVRDDRGLRDMLLADYTYLNDRLAAHYGVPGVYGSHFRRVAVTNPARHGLLGHASLLTVTSYAHRTSPVLRGKWVLENLLGAPPPPPPPNVPPLPENDGNSRPASLRERMAEHRSNPVCASCHRRMDPMGFALENFDGIGRWRDEDDGIPIETVTVLPDGTEIDSPRRFREVLLQGDEFVTTVAEKLLTYAIGRGVDYYDAPAVRRLVRDTASDGYRWSSLVLGIVRSQPFRMRRVPDGAAAPPAPTGVAQRR